MKPLINPLGDGGALPLVIEDWQATVEEIEIDKYCEEVAARYGIRLDAAPYVLAMELLVSQAGTLGDDHLQIAAKAASEMLKTLEMDPPAEE